MASEIKVPLGISGKTLYAIARNAAGQPFNTVTPGYEAYNAANREDYAIALTEQGNDGYYIGDLPAGAVASETITAYDQAGVDPAEGDLLVAAEDRIVKTLMEADEVIVTSTTPWTLEFRYKGTTVVLMTKNLKKLDGTDLTSETVPVGRKLQ